MPNREAAHSAASGTVRNAPDELCDGVSIPDMDGAALSARPLHRSVVLADVFSTNAGKNTGMAGGTPTPRCPTPG